jgi:TDG/mug DNA glycosylase family protein
MKAGLEPLIWPDSRILILGTLPGDESIHAGRYYANPRNQFWTILQAVFEEPVPPDYEGRLPYLRRHGVALWDLLAKADRKGSLDQDIGAAERNDLIKFVGDHPSLEAIALNGNRALELFVGTNFGLNYPSIRRIELPSTSATPGRYAKTLQEKIVAWSVLADF